MPRFQNQQHAVIKNQKSPSENVTVEVPSSPAKSVISSEESPPMVQFVIRSYTLQTVWSWLKKFRATGAIFAMISVLFWSFNGLSYKLNHQIHALEILTISSFAVSVFYLGFMFAFYGVRRYGNAGIIQPFNWSLIFGVPGERTSLMMRCLCGTISLGCFYSSYRYIPLGDATTIRFTSPVFIAIFAHFMIHEPFGWLQMVNAFITLIGVILVGRPSFIFGAREPPPLNAADEAVMASVSPPMPPLWRRVSILDGAENETMAIANTTIVDDDSIATMADIVSLLTTTTTATTTTATDAETRFDLLLNNKNLDAISVWSTTLFGVFLSLVAAILISISMIFMRKIRKTPPPLVIFWFSLSNVVLGAIGLWIIGEYAIPRSLTTWLLILMTIICTGLDQLFITLALKMENASVVAVIQALCVVFSFIFSILILHEPLYWTSALGGFFIFTSVLVLGCSKLIQDLDYSHIKSMIFTINILHSNSRKSFKLEDRYSMLSSGLSVDGSSSLKSNRSSLTTTSSKLRFETDYPHNTGGHRHSSRLFSEPYLLRVAPILANGIPPTANENTKPEVPSPPTTTNMPATITTTSYNSSIEVDNDHHPNRT